MTPPAIMFHHFHGPGHLPSQGSLSADAFEALLLELGLDRILPAYEWMQRAERGTLEETDLCLTFDDNLRCQFDVARPVLRRYGLTAFWFVYTAPLIGALPRMEIYRAFRTRCFDGLDEFYAAFDAAIAEGEFAGEVRTGLRDFDPRNYLSAFPFYSKADRRFRFVRDELLGPDRYEALVDAMIESAGLTAALLGRGLWMDAECLSELQGEGHLIGLHSHTHPTRLEALPAEAQREEYEQNERILTALTGERPTCVAHPCGSYNATTLAILREMGMTLGFRSNRALPAHSLLELPREDHSNLVAQFAAARD